MTEIPPPYRPPVIPGPRIHLRPYRQDDLAAFFALHSDPEAMRYWSHPPWTRIEQAHSKFDSSLNDNAPDSQLCWAIAAPDDGRMIGGVTLFRISAEQGLAEFGYMLERGSWGRGFAREAGVLALDHAFGDLGLRRLEADIDPRNLASCRLVERLGFVREHSCGLLISALKGLPRLLPRLIPAHENEVPRLHEAHGRGIMRSGKQPGDQRFGQRLGEKFVAHIAARFDRTVDGGTLVG